MALEDQDPYEAYFQDNVTQDDPYEAYFPQVAAPEPEEEKPGLFTNAFRKAKERAAELGGNLYGGAETLGSFIDDRVNIGGFAATPGEALSDETAGYKYLPPEEWKKFRESEDSSQLLRELQDEWNAIDFGSVETNYWEDMKNNPGLVNKAKNLGAFMVETGVASLPDMAGAVTMFPAWWTSFSEQMAQERAANDGRPGEPNEEDWAIAGATTAVIGAMERFGFEKIASAYIAGGSAFKNILKAAAGEGGTEFVQEQMEYGAETLGTKTGAEMTGEEYALTSLERGLQGAAGGVGMGATLATPGAVFNRGDQAADDQTPPVTPDEPIISPTVKPLEENVDAIDRELAATAAQTESQQIDEAISEMEQTEIAELEEADAEDRAQEQTFNTYNAADLAARKLGENNLEPVLDQDGTYVLRTAEEADLLRQQAELDPMFGLYNAEGEQTTDQTTEPELPLEDVIQAADQGDYSPMAGRLGEVLMENDSKQRDESLDEVVGETPLDVPQDAETASWAPEEDAPKVDQGDAPKLYQERESDRLTRLDEATTIEEVDAIQAEEDADRANRPEDHYPLVADIVTARKNEITFEAYEKQKKPGGEISPEPDTTAVVEPETPVEPTQQDDVFSIADQLVPKLDEITRDEVVQATENVEPTGEAISAAEEYRTQHPELKDLILSHKPGDDRHGDTMSHYYGEIANTEDADGMPVDVVLNKDNDPKGNPPMFIINQTDWDTGKFRQHKVMAGFSTKAQARQGFIDEWGEKGLESVHQIPPGDFRLWLEQGNTKATFDPKAWKGQLSKIRKQQRKEGIEDFRQEEDQKSVNYSKSNTRNVKAQLQPDPASDDLVLFLRKLGGLNMTNQSDIPAGRLSHLNKEQRIVGLSSIEQTGDKGLSLSQATEAAWDADFIAENDETLFIDAMYEAETDKVWSQQNKEYLEAEAEEYYQEQMDAEADQWSDFVANENEFSEVDPETARLMAQAGEIDQDATDDIIAKNIPEIDVQAQLRDLINDQGQTKTKAADTAEPAREAVTTDEREEGATDLTIPQRDWNQIIDHRESLFDIPGERVRHTTNKEYITQEEADKIRQGWYDETDRQLKEYGAKNANKGIVLSLFDRTGKWAQPWAEAGYDVRLIDLETDGVDVMDINDEWLIDNGMEDVYIVLAACPCTDFSSAGARWMKEKDESGQTQKSVDLVNHTLDIIEWLQPRFWTMENPVGRIGRMTELPKGAKESAEPRLAFHPHNYGDPYTKQTLLWGNFNPDLPQSNVEPTGGSWAHNLRGDVPEQKAARSDTFEGFAYSFFMANNDQQREPEYLRFMEGVVDSYTGLDDQQKKLVALAYEVGVHDGLTNDQVADLSGLAKDAYENGYDDYQDNWVINQDTKKLDDEEVLQKAGVLMSTVKKRGEGGDVISDTPAPDDQAPDDQAANEKPEGPQKTGIAALDEPVADADADTIVNVLERSSFWPEGQNYKSVNEIELTAETEDGKKITHLASFWKNEIDSRLIKLDDLRGCAK